VKGRCALLDRDRLSKEDVEAILAAREARESDQREKGAAELLKILETPSRGSRAFTFNMFGSSDEDEAEKLLMEGGE
jgi:hypothetical protein